jgi:hypothetical protein
MSTQASRDRVRRLLNLISPKVGRWALLGTAVAQAAAVVVLPFGGSPDDDPPIVPASYTFSVWGLIIAGCLAAAVWGVPANRARSAGYRAAQVPLSIVQLLFIAWLTAARSSVVWPTVPIFVAMLVLLVFALRSFLAAASIGDVDRVTGLLLGGTLGVYAGWSSVAVSINATTVLADAGLTTAGSFGLLWQSLALVAACVTVGLLLPLLSAPLAYVTAVVWALVGVCVSTVAAGQPALTAVAACGVVAVVALALRVTRGRAVPSAAT